MITRSSVLAYLLVLLISLTIAPNAQAQEEPIGITNLQHPDQVEMQNGVAQATVTLTLHFTEMNPGYYFIFGIVYEKSLNPVTGSGTSTPDSCYHRPGEAPPQVALCAIFPTSSSGTESASFTLTFNATKQYAVHYVILVFGKSGGLLYLTIGSDFTISVTAQTVPTNPQSTSMIILGLSVIAIAIIGVIVFVVRRRRKGKRTAGTAAEGLASRPSPAPPPAPVPTAEGTKFCTACGVRIPVTAPFCASCGGKQD
jgi:hypothetical protein